MSAFASQVLQWFDQHGRKDLPWQKPATPYRVWISEIMLQQTQVSTVIPYFEKFMARFPSIESLAAAPLDQVLHEWTGLGYYARARNMHKAAGILVETRNGQIPASVEELTQLPGIGRSTAGAIVALGFDRPAPILDGNVKRVLSRYHAIEGWPEQRRVNERLWSIAAQQLPNSRFAAYTQAMMDLGATVCTRTRPACQSCPLEKTCRARQQNTVDLYPGRKPAKPLPVRQTTMHILQNAAGQVLLLKRPAVGIWGGLWSFPETTGPGTDEFELALTLQIDSSLTLPTLRHSFTHFHLDITPVHSRVSNVSASVAEHTDRLWYALDRPARVGLAAPVKKLLEQIAVLQPSQ